MRNFELCETARNLADAGAIKSIPRDRHGSLYIHVHDLTLLCGATFSAALFTISYRHVHNAQ